MPISWSGSRGVCNIEDIKGIEASLGISFPPSYIDLVMQVNGAYPDKKVFDIQGRKGCVFESLINWDKTRKANFYFWLEIIENNKIIPFGKDPFGNAICFDFSSKDAPHIVFWNHENGDVSPIANSFNSFLDILKS